MRYELQKILTKKNLFFIATALLVNLLFLTLDSKNAENAAMISVYREAFSEMEGMSNTQKFNYLEQRSKKEENIETLEAYLELEQLGTMAEYAEIYADYDGYVDALVEHTEQRLALADEKNFFQRDAEKMLRDYQALRGTEVSFESYKGVELADVMVTNVLLLFLVVFLSIEGLIYEKENDILTILRSCKQGRARMLWNRMAALGIVIFALGGVFLLENLLFGASVYGLGDLSRSLQSLPGFEGCSLQISVAAFLLLVWITKWIALCMIGLCALFLAVHSYQMPVVLCGCMAIEGVSYVLYSKIDVQSAGVLMHYLNPFALLKAIPLLNSEVNLNLVGYSVDPFSFVAPFFMIICVLITGVTLRRFQRSSEAAKLSLLARKERKQRAFPVRVLFGEAYKLCVIRMAFVGILVLLAAQILGNVNRKGTMFPQEHYENYILAELEGEVTSEKDTWIQNEYMKSELLSQEAGSYIELEVYNSRILPLQAHLNELKDQTGEAEYIGQAGYERLFGVRDHARDQKNTLLLLALLVCVLSTYVSMEHTGEMKRLIEPTKHGWKCVVKRKRQLAILFGTAALLITWIPDMIWLFRTYRLDDWDAPMSWLLAFQEFPTEITIRMYFVLLIVVRILATIATVCLMIWISNRCSRNVSAFGICTFLFLIPAVLAIFQVPHIEVFSMTGLLDGNCFLQNLIRLF